MKKMFILCLFIGTLFSCGPRLSDDRWHRGEGQFIFTEYDPLSDRPILVYFYIPEEGNIRNMPVLMTVHGAQRTSRPNVDNWKEFASRDGFIIIAPQFCRELFCENDYQFGGVVSYLGATELAARELWVYNLIEAVFDDFLHHTRSRARTYDFWGHSAGGQFVHRMLLSMPEARVGRAVAANPGNWTFPIYGLEDASGKVFGWPFSVKNTPFGCRENLKQFFARDLTVAIGTLDTLTTADDFPRSKEAMAQGRDRVVRGHNFFNTAKQVAVDMGLPFNWSFVEVEGIGHSGRGMVFGRYEMVDGVMVTCIDDLAPISGYNILFNHRK